MLTALVHAASTPGPLAVTLSSLVPAVAEGLVSHAVVLLPAGDRNGERIADAMGATVMSATTNSAVIPWPEAARIARGDWVLLLEAGETPDHGWISAIERHLMQQTASRPRPALMPLVPGFAALGERLAWAAAPGLLRSGLVAARLAVQSGQSGGTPVRLDVTRRRLPPE
jgi:hypothetical protein